MCSLRCVNASANKLEHLPPSSLSEESHSILQEFYLTNNRLTDKCVPMLTGHSHLRILHMAYNHLQTFPARYVVPGMSLECVKHFMYLFIYKHSTYIYIYIFFLLSYLFSKMAKLEELEEVDLSGNMLKTVPTTIMNCRRMHTLVAHSNAIEVFPEVMQLMEMKVSLNAMTRLRQPLSFYASAIN